MEAETKAQANKHHEEELKLKEAESKPQMEDAKMAQDLCHKVYMDDIINQGRVDKNKYLEQMLEQMKALVQG